MAGFRSRLGELGHGTSQFQPECKRERRFGDVQGLFSIWGVLIGVGGVSLLKITLSLLIFLVLYVCNQISLLGRGSRILIFPWQAS